MTPGARVAAAIEIVDRITEGAAPERALTGWARFNRFAGSKDRAAIRDLVFDVLRRWWSTAAQGGGESGRARLIGLLAREDGALDRLFSGEGYAPAPLSDAERAAVVPDADVPDIPPWLWPEFSADLGPDAGAVADTLRARAPVFLRVNLSRSTRDSVVMSLVAEGIEAVPHENVKSALQIIGNARKITGSTAFRQGLCELQDASSQAAVLDAPLVVGDLLDLCAGGGGKALAVADRARAEKMEMRVFAHDIAPARMADIPARANRADVQITRLAPDDLLGRQFQTVLIDAPCSGSGTWRRAPGGKLILTPEGLGQLTSTQEVLLDQGAALTRPGGVLVYMTCSVLKRENGAQIASFLARRKGWTVLSETLTLPGTGGDGFYTCGLRCPEPQP